MAMEDLKLATFVDSEPMASVYGELRKLMGELGVDVGVWATDGSESEPWRPRCRFTEMCEQSGGEIKRACSELAARAISQDRPASSRAQTGHCIIALPIHQRRRLVGAAAGSFPVREMLEEEHLARLCDRLQLDRKAALEQARGSVRHSSDQIEDFLRILDGMQAGIQSRIIARQDLESFSDNLATTYEELSLLYRTSGSMHVTQKPEQFLNKVCEELQDVMDLAASVAIVYAHPPAIEEDLVVISGRIGLLADQTQAFVNSVIAPRLAAEDRPVLDNHFLAASGELSEGPVANFVAVPLISEEHTIGILVGLNKRSGEFDSVDVKLITAIGGHAGVFLTNNNLYADLQDLLMGVLHALTATIDAKDPYTSGHSQRVALISKRLAEECDFDSESIQRIYLAGLLHDIGKIGVPEAILCKAGRLTDEEYEDMKRHPMIGANILGGIRQLDEMIPGILAHHEKVDGSGYPRGLSGDEIPIEGRIICIADSFDAMSSYRRYRDALPLEKVIGELSDCAGEQFDAQLVERFLSIDLERFMGEIHQPAKTVFPFRIAAENRR